MATHSSILFWRIPGTGEPGGLPSVGLHRVGHDWSDLAVAAMINKVEDIFKCLLTVHVSFFFFSCIFFSELKNKKKTPIQTLPLFDLGTGLVVQWLRLGTPNAGGPGSIPGQGARAQKLQLKILHPTTKTPSRQINKYFWKSTIFPLMHFSCSVSSRTLCHHVTLVRLGYDTFWSFLVVFMTLTVFNSRSFAISI